MFNQNKILNIFIKLLFLVFDILFFKKDKSLWVISIPSVDRFDGNVRAIYEHYKENKIDMPFQLKVIIDDVNLNQNNDDFIVWGSVNHFITLLKSSVILYHHNFNDTGLITVNRSRLYYRVAHGIHYKKVERAHKKPRGLYQNLISTKNLIPFHSVSSKQDALSAVAYFHIYLDDIDITGSAKNDLLIMKKLPSFYAEQENQLNIELKGRSLITYAPTWREVGGAFTFSENEIVLLEEYLKQHNLVFGYAGHQYLKNRVVPDSPYFLDLNNLNVDIQVILRNTEILVTDYSSIWLDFLLLEKKILFFQFDKKDYTDDRGFLFDTDLIGFQDRIAYDVKALIGLFDKKIDSKLYLLKDFFHAYSDGENVKRTINAIQHRNK